MAKYTMDSLRKAAFGLPKTGRAAAIKPKTRTQCEIRKAQSASRLDEVVWHVYGHRTKGFRAMPYDLRSGELREGEIKIGVYRGVSRKTALARAKSGKTSYEHAA